MPGTLARMPINIATILTLIRIALIPVLILVFYSDIRHHNHIAAFIFIAAALTDWLDGYLARKYNLESAFGAFLDPVADKLMVSTVLILLVQAYPEPWLAVLGAVIIGREISISALREWMAEIGKRARVKVAFTGKIKTIAQMVALAMLLYHDDLFSIPIRLIGEWCLVIAAVLTLWSAAQYLMAARVALKELN
jgi:CDP-diacylglycerol---glycerol-3-phosphate 3-phosphatidyltransferase